MQYQSVVKSLGDRLQDLTYTCSTSLQLNQPSRRAAFGTLGFRKLFHKPIPRK